MRLTGVTKLHLWLSNLDDGNNETNRALRINDRIRQCRCNCRQSFVRQGQKNCYRWSFLGVWNFPNRKPNDSVLTCFSFLLPMYFFLVSFIFFLFLFPHFFFLAALWLFLNPLQPGAVYLYPLKISENLKVSDIFRGYR